MNELYQLRRKVYQAASEYYRAHTKYLDNSRQRGKSRQLGNIWKECIDAGNSYKKVLQNLISHLTTLRPREPHEEAINSAEHLLLSLDYKLNMLRPQGQQQSKSATNH